MRRLLGLCVALALALPTLARAQDLPPETIAGWDLYVARTEARIESELGNERTFLVLDTLDPSERSRCEETIRRGKVCALKRETRTAESKPIEVPGGLVHHWYGSVFVPGVSLDRVLDWVQTYDHRERYYPDVEASRLISRDGDEFKIFLRLKRRKILTAEYDTEHEVTYRREGQNRASSRSVATRIRELDNVGSDREVELSPDKDRGFLWRLNSYWRFEERDGGTVVECESISLSRTIPQAVFWLVRTFITSVPRESLEATLLPIRKNLEVSGSPRSSRGEDRALRAGGALCYPRRDADLSI